MSSSRPTPLRPLTSVPAVADPEVRAPATQELLGVPLARTAYERTMDWMDAAVAERRREYVWVAAVQTVMACAEDPELGGAVLGSSLAVPDGQPLVWAMNALGHHLPSRVYGPELMARHCERSARTGTRMFLYGGRNQRALVQLALNLRTQYPRLRNGCGHAPPLRP